MTKEQILENFDPSQPGLADATILDRKSVV